MSKQKNNSRATSLEDLDSESDNDSQSNNINPPPVAIRTGPGGYDMSNEFGNPEEQNRNIVNHTKTSTQPAVGTGNDLMATAMAMQKAREVDDSGSRSNSAFANQRTL